MAKFPLPFEMPLVVLTTAADKECYKKQRWGRDRILLSLSSPLQMHLTNDLFVFTL